MEKIITNLAQEVYELNNIFDNGTGPIFIPRKHHYNANNKRKEGKKKRSR